MAFLRLTRDSRGYETTVLLHASHPGEEPRVLYCYRTAPGVRVGRPPLDEDAIRTIEERHPDIEFDWPHILEVGATLAPEVERRPERPRRRPRGSEDVPAVSERAEESETPPSTPTPAEEGRGVAIPEPAATIPARPR